MATRRKSFSSDRGSVGSGDARNYALLSFAFTSLIIEYGSPNLIFSNVLWGYLIRGIPPINGVLGYSIGTITVLLMVRWAMLYFLLRPRGGSSVFYLKKAR